MTALILETFRLHGALIADGDRLTAPLGLTAARWQVLSCVARAAHPAPVAHVAREMGLARQSVQRIVNQLVESGLMAFADNPHHKRAPLVALTAGGSTAFRRITDRQVPWVNDLARGMTVQQIDTALEVLRRLRGRLTEDDRHPRQRGDQVESGRRRTKSPRLT